MNFVQIVGTLGIGALLAKLVDLWLTRVAQENDRKKWLRDQRLVAYADLAKDFLSLRLGGDGLHDNPFEAYAVASRSMLLAHDDALVQRIDHFIIDLHYFYEAEKKEDKDVRATEQLYNELNDRARTIVRELRAALVELESKGVERVASMKRTLALAFAFGAGVGLVAILGLAVRSYWTSSPSRWNQNAVTASFDSVDTEGAERKLVFFYVLSNNTDRDFRIDSHAEVRLMGRLQRQAALTTENFKELLAADLPLFVPAKQRTRLAVHLNYQYAGSTPLSQGTSKTDRERDEKAVTGYVREELSNLDGFVIFHEPSHYEIDLPNGWKK